MDLQARAQQKFAEMQASFAEGIKTARDVQKDLEWTQKKVEYDSCTISVRAINANSSPVRSMREPLKNTLRNIRWLKIDIRPLWIISFLPPLFSSSSTFFLIFVGQIAHEVPERKAPHSFPLIMFL
jgi:hypothetical protein